MGIDHTERLIIVDDDNEVVGSATRQQAQADGLNTRVSQVWVINDQQQILCHLRTELLEFAPGKWDPVFGGMAGVGETPIQTALKELAEESSISVGPADLHYWGARVYEGQSKKFQSIYWLHWNGEINDLALEAEEVAAVKWISLSELKQVYQQQDRDWVQRGYETELIEQLTALS